MRAFLTLPEGRHLGEVKLRGTVGAYVARFRGGRPLDLIELDADGPAAGTDEPLQSAELPTARGGSVQVYYSPRAAILVSDRGRHLLTAPASFDNLGDVHEALKSGEFNLITGFEPLPGDPVIQLEPLLGDPIMEIEPSTPRGGAKPRLRYEKRTCPGPPSHFVWVRPSHPFCPLHDLRAEPIDPSLKR